MSDFEKQRITDAISREAKLLGGKRSGHSGERSCSRSVSFRSKSRRRRCRIRIPLLVTVSVSVRKVRRRFITTSCRRSRSRFHSS